MSILWGLGLVGCASFAPGEGQKEVDPGDSGPSDTGGPGDTDPSGTVDTGEERHQVCYPGSSGAYEACLDLVSHEESWGSDYAYPTPFEGNPQYAAPLRFVDLSTADPDLFLSSNFLLDELMQEYKGRYGLFQVHALEALQRVRDRVGGAIFVNSAYRNISYNYDAGGVENSRHIYGDGVDMYSNTVSLTQLGVYCDAEGAGFSLLYTTHVHCDWRSSTLDPAFYGEDSPRAGPPLPPLTAELVAGPGRRFRVPVGGFDEGEPLRVWTATDAEGNVLQEYQGKEFQPPPGAVELQVVVGGRIVLSQSLN